MNFHLFSEWKKYSRVSKPSKAVIQKTRASISNKVYHWNWTLLISVSLKLKKVNIVYIYTIDLNYSYLIENEVCYLVLCEKNYSKRIAYNFLEDIAQEFSSQYGAQVNRVTRPYSFIEFGTNFNWKTVDPNYSNRGFLLCFNRYIYPKSKKNFSRW